MKRLLTLLFLLLASCETTLPEGDNYVPDFKNQAVQGVLEGTDFEMVDYNYEKTLSVMTFYLFDKVFTPEDTTQKAADSAALDTLRQLMIQIPREHGLHRITTWGNYATISGVGIEGERLLDFGAVNVDTLSFDGDTVHISIDVFSTDDTYVNGMVSHQEKKKGE